MGLWAAVEATRAGLSVTLVDRAALGQGTSGGFLGALMPHTPERWNEKKQFQLDSLVALEDAIARIEGETGLSTGYRRTGRILPLAKPHQRDNAQKQAIDAATRWQIGTRKFAWEVRDQSPHPGWPDPSASSSGLVFETLAARVDPRLLLACLIAWLRKSDTVTIIEGVEIEAIDPVTCRAHLADARILAFGSCILSAGVATFPLIDRLPGAGAMPSGMAVKGQAALLDARVDPELPILYTDGLYIVPHDSGRVAIGSTSENNFAEPFSTDGLLDDLLVRARTLVPSLADAPVLERWAGLRPKAIGREPMIGQHPDFPSIQLLTGGFKVSFGLAQRLARSVIADMTGREPIVLPQSFRVETHLAMRKAPNTGASS